MPWLEGNVRWKASSLMREQREALLVVLADRTGFDADEHKGEVLEKIHGSAPGSCDRSRKDFDSPVP